MQFSFSKLHFPLNIYINAAYRVAASSSESFKFKSSSNDKRLLVLMMGSVLQDK